MLKVLYIFVILPKKEVGAATKIASDSLLLNFDDSADAAVMENIGWRLRKGEERGRNNNKRG